MPKQMYTSVNVAIPYIFIVTTDITVLTVGHRKHIICHLFPFFEQLKIFIKPKGGV